MGTDKNESTPTKPNEESTNEVPADAAKHLADLLLLNHRKHKKTWTLTNAVFPKPSNVARNISEFGLLRPAHYINLVKFRKRALYPDGRHTTWTGAQAYSHYANEVRRLLLPTYGISVTLAGVCRGLIIGHMSEEYDAVAILRYPSFLSVIALTASPLFQAIHLHRLAGLEGEINIMVHETYDLASL